MFESDSEKWWLGIVAGLLVVLASFLVDTVVDSTTFKALKIIGVVVGLYSAYSQWRTLRPFVLEFSSDDWMLNEEGSYSLKIPRKMHRKGLNPVVECLMKRDGSYQVVGLVKSVSNGDVMLGANSSWAGKAIVK